MCLCHKNIWNSSAQLVCLMMLLCACNINPTQKKVQVPSVYVQATDNALAQQGTQLWYKNQPFAGYVYQLDSLKQDTILLAGYYNGLLQGLLQKWYSKNHLMEYRFFEQGEKHGPQITWWPNGYKKFAFTAEHDAYEGEMKEWDIDGKLFHLAHYKKGQEEGEQKMWYSNGKIRANYVMINGRRYGLLGTKNCKNVSDSIFNNR